MKRLYLAGPYTQGDVAANVREAIRVADELSGRGYIVFIPHLSHFWHLVSPKPYEFWMQQDAQWLTCCDVLYRMPGPSDGADTEVAQAKDLGIPVFTDLDQLP